MSFPWRAVGRAAFYLVALTVAVGVLIFGAQRTIANSMVACMDAPDRGPISHKAPGNVLNLLDCLEGHSNALGKLGLYPMSRRLRALPSAPEGYSGYWISQQNDCRYCIENGRDGRFSAKALVCPRHGEQFTGAWAVVGDEMIWMYDQGRIWPPAINPIEEIAALGFVLREADGARTQFRRPLPAEATVCGPRPLQAEVPPSTDAVPDPTIETPREAENSARPPDVTGIKLAAPDTLPLEALDEVLSAARTVAASEAVVDALVRWCAERAPQYATMARLAREVWRTRQQRLLGMKSDVLRGLGTSRREFVARVEAAARQAGEERIESLARPGGPSPASWCQGIEDSLAAPEFDLKSDPSLVRRMAAAL